MSIQKSIKNNISNFVEQIDPVNQFLNTRNESHKITFFKLCLFFDFLNVDSEYFPYKH